MVTLPQHNAHRNSFANPSHHLWRNRGPARPGSGVWWINVAVWPDGYTKARIRQSLGTHDLTEARKRRDSILDRIRRGEGESLLPNAQPNTTISL